MIARPRGVTARQAFEEAWKEVELETGPEMKELVETHVRIWIERRKWAKKRPARSEVPPAEGDPVG